MYHFRIKWLTAACFEMEKDGKHMVTDPFITLSENSPCTWENIEGCDLITLSHVHWDHITDIPVLMDKFGQLPLLTGSLSALPLLEWGNLYPQSVYPMDANLELDFDWVKVKALFGRHTAFGETVNQLIKTAQEAICGQGHGRYADPWNTGIPEFLFTFPDGMKVLVWGNDFTAVQKISSRRSNLILL